MEASFGLVTGLPRMLVQKIREVSSAPRNVFFSTGRKTSAGVRAEGVG
jgi:hypothetical protein